RREDPAVAAAAGGTGNRVNRRAFVTGLGALFTAPHIVGAQQTGRVYRVGALYQGEPSAPISVMFRQNFTQGLRDEGYVEGENLKIEYRHGDLDQLFDAAHDLLRLNVDVIIAGGTPAALAAKRATTTTPIVVVAMADPVADGLVASLARPQGNI